MKPNRLLPPRALVIKPSLLRCMITPSFLPSLTIDLLFLMSIDLWARGIFPIPPTFLITIGFFSLAFLFAWLQKVSFSCYVTAQQIWVDRGILWKRTQFFELYRIRDYAESRDILDRLFGTMQLRLYTMDTNPFDLLELQNIPYSPIAMLIRERVQHSKKTNNMFFVENDSMR